MGLGALAGVRLAGAPLLTPQFVLDRELLCRCDKADILTVVWIAAEGRSPTT